MPSGTNLCNNCGNDYAGHESSGYEIVDATSVMTAAANGSCSGSGGGRGSGGSDDEAGQLDADLRVLLQGCSLLSKYEGGRGGVHHHLQHLVGKQQEIRAVSECLQLTSKLCGRHSPR
jgi:hypothetical protein